MRPSLRTFAVLGAVGCVLGGLLGEWLFPPRPAPASAPARAAIALVIDASGSMDEAGKLQEVKRAARDFVARQDLRTTRVAVVGFGSRAHLESPLSSDPGQLRQAIERIADGGGTMMAEGLEAGLQALGEADTPARSLLLFTDGVPGSTTVSPRVASRAALSAAERARAQGVRLVAVATEDADRAFLERLTGSSELVFSTTAGQFGEAFRQAERAIRQLFGEPSSSSLAQVLWETFLRGALAALGLGLLLLLGENLLTLRGHALRDVAWVPLGAALLGGAAAFAGQVLLSTLGGGRGLGWAVLGAGTGLLLGLADRSRAKAVRGALGGLGGGLAGGLVFEGLLGLGSGALARLAGFAVLGAFVGMMVQWAQQAFKTAWLVGVGTGPYEGKEYILAKPVVTVGRSDANDIGLYRERDLPLKAGVLRLEQGVWRWEGQPVPVNGVVTPQQALRPGDRLRLGTAEFMFQARGAQPPETLDAWALQGNTQTHPLPFPLRQATLGSDPRCTVVIRGQRVAPRQAEIRAGAQGLELVALAEGVQVNGEGLPQGQRRRLEPGDLLTLGAEEFALIRRRG